MIASSLRGPCIPCSTPPQGRIPPPTHARFVIAMAASAWCIVVGGLSPSAASADEPAVLYVFPAGGQRGTKVTARIGGMHLFESAPLHMHAAGVKADPRLQRIEKIWFEGPVIPIPDSQRAEDYPSDYRAVFAINADAQPGCRWWRVSTVQGVTASQRFVVGDEPEVVEAEVSGTPLPVTVTLPITVNGRIFPREDVDLWRFEAAAGQVVRCEVNAARLGSPLDAQLEIADLEGRVLASSSDRFGADSGLVFTAPAAGFYEARIRDAAMGGLQSYVYRLTLSSQPHVASVYPLGGRRGSAVVCELTGVNLPAGPVEVAIPPDAADDHDTRLTLAGHDTNLVRFETGDRVEVLEREPNNTAECAAEVGLPAVLNGRIDEGGDVDCWSFQASKGAGIEFELRAARLGSPLDSVLVVTDDTGKEITRADDASTLDTDSRVLFTAPAAGRYTVKVSDRYQQRGGPTFAYRLHAAPASPDFRLVLAADTLTVDRSSTARVKLIVQRSGGFSETIRLLGDGLPQGVSFAPLEIKKNEQEATLLFKAAAEAPLGLIELTIVGVAAIGDNRVSRVAARAVERGEPPLPTVWLATALPTPFQVVGTFVLPYAARGGTFTRHYSLKRNGYDGPVDISLAEKQMRHLQGVTGPSIVVPAGVNEFDYVVDLPSWMELSRTSRSIVTASALVDDGTGTKQRVSSTSPHQNEQISMIIAPGAMSLTTTQSTITPSADRPVELDVQIVTTQILEGPVRVEIALPTHIHGITAAPIELSAEHPRGRLAIRFTGDAGPFNVPLTIRASHGSGTARIGAETSVDIVPLLRTAGQPGEP